jgi:hypothetical protein
MSRRSEPHDPHGMTPNGASAEQRASTLLAELARAFPAQGLTLGALLTQLGERGELIISMVLTVPFLLPVSIPGSSIPFGLLIALNGIGLLLHRPPWLPKRLMAHRLTGAHSGTLLAKASRLFSRLERFIHPRLLPLTHEATWGRANGLLLVLSGLLLTAPLPLPFSNTLPAYGALFLAAGSLERDGACIVAGYTMVFLTIVYFILIAVLGRVGMQVLWFYL